jgi:hypothetical protein
MPWTLVTALLTLALAPIVANVISHEWQEARKQRDLDLQSLGELYALYGEFCTTWKLAHGINAIGDDRPEGPAMLLERAASAEGRMEALVVRIAAERPLSGEQVERLGALRQVYQRARESLLPRAKERGAGVHEWGSAGSPGYVALKALTVEVASILNEPRPLGRSIIPRMRDHPSNEAGTALLRATSNRWEYPTWLEVGLSLPSVLAYRSDLESEIKQDRTMKRREEARQELCNLRSGEHVKVTS